LAGFVTAAGSAWSATALDDFFLASSPTNNGYVTCNTELGSTFSGLEAGFALEEFTGVSLNTCAANCIAHNPAACLPNKSCAYSNACTGFYYWNEQVNLFVGATDSLASGYDQEVGHCILLNNAWTSSTGTPNDQCVVASSDDTASQQWMSFSLDITAAAATTPRLKSTAEFDLRTYTYSLMDYFIVLASVSGSQATVGAAVDWSLDWWAMF